MNPNPLLRAALAALGGRTPVPAEDQRDAIRVCLQYETAELTFPALIVSCSLSRAAALPRNFTAEFDLVFSLIIPAADFSADEHDAQIRRVAALLAEKITTKKLASAALIGGESCRVYAVDWAETSEQTTDGDGNLTLSWTFRGLAQF